ncbi:MAG: hypothetical protein ACKVWR_08665, partial [Acidimicrobiales bacterium]
AAGRFTPEEKVSVQLACNFTAAAAAKAISLVHQVVGASAVRDEAGFEKLFRDANTITQHVSHQPARWESAGKVMLGLESGWFPFNL